MVFVDPTEILQFGSPSSWQRDYVNGICGPSPDASQFGSTSSWYREDLNGLVDSPAKVLKFASPNSWHREDVHGICRPPPLRFYNLGVPAISIGRI